MDPTGPATSIVLEWNHRTLGAENPVTRMKLDVGRSWSFYVAPKALPPNGKEQLYSFVGSGNSEIGCKLPKVLHFGFPWFPQNSTRPTRRAS